MILGAPYRSRRGVKDVVPKFKDKALANRVTFSRDAGHSANVPPQRN